MADYMLIAPIYMRVGDGARGLCITAVSYADSMQLLRVWAVPELQSVQKVAEFQPFELRPDARGLAARHVMPFREAPYWLAILAFHRGESAWERSGTRHGGPFNVPEVHLAFTAPEASGNVMGVSVIYT